MILHKKDLDLNIILVSFKGKTQEPQCAKYSRLRNSAPKSAVIRVLSPCVPVKIFIIKARTENFLLFNRYNNINSFNR